MKIVIVDDSNLARVTLRRILVDAGFDDDGIFDAANGVDALKLIEQGKPDLVLCDWNMPRETLTGFDVLKIVRARGNDVRFGFVTSEASGTMLDRATRAGAEFVLAKPVAPEALIDAVGDLAATPNGVGAPSDNPGITLNEWIEVTQLAVERVFELVLGDRDITATVDEERPAPPSDGGVFVSIRSEVEVVQLGLYMEAGSRQKLARRLLGRRPADPEPTEEDTSDAIRELLNMLAGLVKAEFVEAEKMSEVRIGIPVFVYGTIVANDAMQDQFLHVDAGDSTWGLQVLHCGRRQVTSYREREAA